jgi:hypothetical protein
MNVYAIVCVCVCMCLRAIFDDYDDKENCWITRQRAILFATTTDRENHKDNAYAFAFSGFDIVFAYSLRHTRTHTHTLIRGYTLHTSVQIYKKKFMLHI